MVRAGLADRCMGVCDHHAVEASRSSSQTTGKNSSGGINQRSGSVKGLGSMTAIGTNEDPQPEAALPYPDWVFTPSVSDACEVR